MLRVRHVYGSRAATWGMGAPVPAQDELQTFIRTFPRCATAVQIAEALYKAAEFGRTVIAALPAMSTVVDINAGSLEQKIQRARDLENVWRGRIPWFWQETETWCKGAGQLYNEAFNAITNIYQESSGVAGAGTAVEKARAQLVDDLTDPLNPNSFWGEFWRAHKLAIIAGASLVVAGPFVWRKLKGGAPAPSTELIPEGSDA